MEGIMSQRIRASGQALLQSLYLNLPPLSEGEYQGYQQLESAEAGSSTNSIFVEDVQRFNTYLEQLMVLRQQDNALGHIFDQRLQRYDADALRRHRRQFYLEMCISSIVSALMGWLLSPLASPVTLFSTLWR
jgi:hypothetical protein